MVFCVKDLVIFRFGVAMPVPMRDSLTPSEISNESEPPNTTPVHPSHKQTSRVRSNTEKAESGLGELDDDSDIETTAPQPPQQERTRQKKFIKNFKHLQDETVVERK